MGDDSMTEKILKKILLVEDEPDIRAIACVSLEDIGGFTVEYCASGKEALEVAENFAPDLILLDVMMPEMDGVTTLKKLREKPLLKKTPVIFLTARTQVSDIARYIELGALTVITKPFNPMSLAEVLQTIWRQYHGR